MQNLDEKIKDLICEGCTQEQIADKIRLSLPAVKKRIQKIKKSFGAKNITDLAVKITILRFSNEFL